MEFWIIILIHQLIFQGMFAVKNIFVLRKTGLQIRGRNIEASLSIGFFILFIVLTLAMGFLETSWGKISILNDFTAAILGCLILVFSLLVSAASLINMKDSWRIGVVEDQKTNLITSGIYRFTRNPYFVSYFLIFFGYTILLQNLILAGLSVLGFFLVHSMIKKEEIFLEDLHGDIYREYKAKVPRYIIS